MNILKFATTNLRTMEVLMNPKYIVYKIPVMYDKEILGSIDSIRPLDNFICLYYRRTFPVVNLKPEISYSTNRKDDNEREIS